MNNLRRVAITGLGAITPLGNTPEAFFASLMAGKSGIGRLRAEFTEHLDCKIAAQCDFNGLDYFSKHRASTLDRASQFALVAAQQAVDDARLQFALLDRTRTGVSIGTIEADLTEFDELYTRLFKKGAKRLKPFSILMNMNSSPASQIAMEYELLGFNLTYSIACSSSAVAIGEAFQKIRYGLADVMLAGGTESPLAFGFIKAWEALRVLAKEDENDPSMSCKPFAADRSGLVLGEGAAIVVLEEWDHAKARGVKIYGE
jgi:3-oxoacyl-[acyl-carrier-protein] synthase II